MSDQRSGPFTPLGDAESGPLTPPSLRELTEEEVVAAARSFWLDDWCKRVDDDDDPALPYEV